MSWGNVSSDSVSKHIIDVESHLKNKFVDYDWIKNFNDCSLTSDVSNSIPNEMLSNGTFRQSEINQAIINAEIQDKTDYGGCGPIAALGILDYFSRYLGYDEIIEDPTSSNQRIKLATEFLSKVNFSIFSSSDKGTLVWPWDLKNTFNEIISDHGLSGIITANQKWKIFGGDHNDLWNDVVTYIDKGLPVTMGTGRECGNGAFARHYTNIYGYENWIGIPKNGGERLTKKFLKARLNHDSFSDAYCDADILKCGETALLTYNVNYANSYNFQDSDFAEEFVNSDGGGQYFFNTTDEPVNLSNGIILQTSRLRTSYIEDEYLVLSPNRANAGTAYLDITFPNSVSKMSFSTSMWSSLEGVINEDFKIQYYDNKWNDHISIEPSGLSTLKDYPDSFVTLFPKDIKRVRFYATHSAPSGDRNKGRICISDFKIEYN